MDMNKSSMQRQFPCTTLKQLTQWKENVKTRFNKEDQNDIESTVHDSDDENDLIINQIFQPGISKKLILSRSNVYYGYVNGNPKRKTLFEWAVNEKLFKDLDDVRYTTRPWERFVIHPSVKTNMMNCMLNGVIAYSNIPGKPYTWSNGANEFANIRYESNLHKCLQYLLIKLYKKTYHDTINMEIRNLVNEELKRLHHVNKFDRDTASYICDVVIATYVNKICNDINVYSRAASQNLQTNFKLYHLYQSIFGFVPRYAREFKRNVEVTSFGMLPSSDNQDFIIPEIENLLIIYSNGQVKAYDWFHRIECECGGNVIMDIDTVSVPTFKSLAETLWFKECRNRELCELLYRAQAPVRYIITEKKQDNDSSSSSSSAGSNDDEIVEPDETGKRKKISKRTKERNDKYAHAKRMRELQIKKEIQQYDRKLKEMVRAEEMRDRHSALKEENKALNVCDRLLLKVSEHQRRTQCHFSNLSGDQKDDTSDTFGFMREVKQTVEDKRLELDRIKKLLSGYGIFESNGAVGGVRQQEQIETIVDSIISKSIETFMKELNMITDQAKHLYDKTHSKIAQITDMPTPAIIGNTENEYVNDFLYKEADNLYGEREQLTGIMGDLQNQASANEGVQNLVRIDKEVSAIDSLKEKLKAQLALNAKLTEQQQCLVDRLNMTVVEGVKTKAQFEAEKKMKVDLKKLLDTLSSITFKTLKDYEDKLQKLLDKCKDRDKMNKSKMKELADKCDHLGTSVSEMVSQIAAKIQENAEEHKKANKKYNEWLNGLENRWSKLQETPDVIATSAIDDKNEILEKASEPLMPISGCKGFDDHYTNLSSSDVKIIELKDHFRKADIGHKISLDTLNADSKLLKESWELAIDTIVPCRVFFTNTSHRTRQININEMCTDHVLPFFKFIYRDIGAFNAVSPQSASKDELFTHSDESVKEFIYKSGGKLYAMSALRSRLEDTEETPLSLVPTSIVDTNSVTNDATIFHTLEN